MNGLINVLIVTVILKINIFLLTSPITHMLMFLDQSIQDAGVIPFAYCHSNRYVYYGCNRSEDRLCKCQYIREEELISDLMKQIDQLEINNKEVRKKFQKEFEGATRFQKKFMGAQTKQSKVSYLDIKSYVKHVLSEGSLIEKRESVGEIKNKLVLRDKRIVLEEN